MGRIAWMSPWVSLAAVALGCATVEPPPEPVTPSPAAPASAPLPEANAGASAPDAGLAGARCTTNADCGEHAMCAGPAGCDAAWTCVPARPCTRDLLAFCGCDGKTFMSSSSCPSAPYRRVGSCF